jgi:MGT family glycosyltransferase
MNPPNKTDSFLNISALGEKMARVWFYNIPYHGHVNPTLPLIRELVERGEEVTYFSTPAFADRVQATGANFQAYGNEKAFVQSRKVTHTVHLGSLVAEATYALLPEVLASVENERPDYLIFDMSAPWGSIASRRYGIPAVASFPHFPFYWGTVMNDRRVFRKMVASTRPGFTYWRRLERLTRKIVQDFHLRKLQDINVISSSAETNIVFSSRYFQPYEEHFDDSYHYIGPVINIDRYEEPLNLSRSRDQKLIYIAVGTVYQANLGFLRDCIRAFADDRYVVILSVGRAVDPTVLEPIPHNFTVAQFVPQLSILQEADVFITHGGMNSIAESVINGVPMIVVPNTLEQSINASRVEQLQAGLYLEPERISIGLLQNSVEAVLADPSLIRGIERIRKSFLEAGGVQRAVDAIQEFKNRQGLNSA